MWACLYIREKKSFALIRTAGLIRLSLSRLGNLLSLLPEQQLFVSQVGLIQFLDVQIVARIGRHNVDALQKEAKHLVELSRIA